jgi:hypothetical protein
VQIAFVIVANSGSRTSELDNLMPLIPHKLFRAFWKVLAILVKMVIF